YMMKELINYSIDKRRSVLDDNKVLLGNYLSYAMTCGWINQIDFILHDLWENDLFRLHLKNFDINEKAFAFKGVNKTIDLSLMKHNIFNGNIIPSAIDPEIPFTLIPWQEFESKEGFDYLVFCQSPGYTPASADYMLNVVRDYLIEI